MAELFDTERGRLTVRPNDGKEFTYEELKHLISGKVGGKVTIQIVPLPDGRSIVVDDNGKLSDEPKVNEQASEFWREQYPIEKYPHNNDGTIVGNMLVATDEELGEGEEEEEGVSEGADIGLRPE